MFCMLWVIFSTLAVVVQGGVSSGSAEALLKGGAKNNGGGAAATGNVGNAGAQNGVPLAGEAIMARLVQLGGSLFIQPVANPGQPPLQQLIPISALQQGGTFLLGQGGGANGNLQMAQQAGSGPVMLYALAPQNNAGIGPDLPMQIPGQVQLFSVAGPNTQQQQLGVAAGGAQARGRLRFQRSVAARLRRMQSPLMKAEADEEEEEISGMDTEEKQQ
ncbi:hypothetical protein ILYODFUR_004313 [Ilyodon furcidens]|uniref:Uncharacterized protein n=1 Tax=Ilyodon furcidens TaxID=33524 RepID=A0ABV0T6T6_9TELE